MNWITDTTDIRIGYDVLIQDIFNVYYAGIFKRVYDARHIIFQTKDGAWTVELKSIIRFCYIED